MSAALAPRATARSPRLGLVIGLATLFWAFTFGIVVLRAELSPDGPHGVIGFRRLFGTLAGAIAYGFVLRWIFASGCRRGASQALAIIGTILPASLLVLAVRAIANAALYAAPEPWEENVRWVLVWSGYFGLWVSATLAFQHHGSHRRDRPVAAAPAAPPIAAPQAEAGTSVIGIGPEPLSEAWLAFIDAAAAEMRTLPDADRTALADRLSQTAAYELADDGWSGGVGNARADLTRRILARMDDSPNGRP